MSIKKLIESVEISNEAKMSTIAKVFTASLDTGGILRDVKTVFMRACQRMYGDPNKLAVILEFLNLAEQIAIHQYTKQKDKRDARIQEAVEQTAGTSEAPVDSTDASPETPAMLPAVIELDPAPPAAPKVKTTSSEKKVTKK